MTIKPATYKSKLRHLFKYLCEMETSLSENINKTTFENIQEVIKQIINNNEYYSYKWF